MHLAHILVGRGLVLGRTWVGPLDGGLPHARASCGVMWLVSCASVALWLGGRRTRQSTRCTVLLRLTYILFLCSTYNRSWPIATNPLASLSPLFAVIPLSMRTS